MMVLLEGKPSKSYKRHSPELQRDFLHKNLYKLRFVYTWNRIHRQFLPDHLITSRYFSSELPSTTIPFDRLTETEPASCRIPDCGGLDRYCNVTPRACENSSLTTLSFFSFFVTCFLCLPFKCIRLRSLVEV